MNQNSNQQLDNWGSLPEVKVDLSSKDYLRHRFRHYPQEAKDLAIDYLINNNEESLQPLIKCILVKYSVIDDLDISNLNDDSEIQNDFGVDSLGVMEIIMFLEETFETVIEIEKWQTIVTLKDVIEVVKEIRSNK